MYIETAEDLIRKYQDSYIIYNDNLVYCQGFSRIDSTTSKVLIHVVNEKSETTSVIFEPDLLKLLIFDAQFFNMIDSRVWAVQFRRRPHRSPLKGLHHATAVLFSPNNLFPYNLVETKLNFKTIHSLLNPFYPMYSEAFEICEQRLAVALSKDFYILLSPKKDTNFLFGSQHGLIGEIVDNPNYIKIHHEPFRQEVLDFVHKHKLNQVSVV